MVLGLVGFGIWFGFTDFRIWAERVWAREKGFSDRLGIKVLDFNWACNNNYINKHMSIITFSILYIFVFVIMLYVYLILLFYIVYISYYILYVYYYYYYY